MMRIGEIFFEVQARLFVEVIICRHPRRYWFHDKWARRISTYVDPCL